MTEEPEKRPQEEPTEDEDDALREPVQLSAPVSLAVTLSRVLLRVLSPFEQLSRRGRITLALGAVIAFNVLRRVARENPSFAPYVTILMAIYTAVVFLTWLSGPLIILVLMLDPVARMTIDPGERRAALNVGACLGIALVFAVASLGQGRLLGSALGLAFAALAFATAYGANERWRRWLTGFAASAAGLAFAAGVLPAETGAPLLTGAILVSLASTWVGVLSQ